MSPSSALVIDSSPAMRNYVRKILRQDLRFDQIHEGKDADDALRILKSGRLINWIFSSWELPGLSTHDFLQIIRNSFNNMHSRFVLMSANDERVVRNFAIQEGIADYLCKPFAPCQMVNLVHRLTGLVERRKAERFKVSLPCEIDIGFDSFHHYGAELVDISMTGCRVKTSPVKSGSGYIGDFATVTLLPEMGETFQVEAKIRRLEFDQCCTDPLRNTQIAVEFIDATAALKERLEAFVSSCRAQSAAMWHACRDMQ